MEILRVCAVAVCGVTAITLIKNWKGEFVIPLKSVVLVCLLFSSVGIVRPVLAGIDGITSLFDGAEGLASYGALMIRALGVALFASTCADLCRDAGESAVAAGVETVAKLELLLCGLPLIREVIESARGLLEL